jgi:hypothetical protein
MVTYSDEILGMVFKPVIRSDLGNFSLDGQSLSILMALDGKKSIGSISAKVGIDAQNMASVIKQLLQLKLIEAIPQKTSPADSDFFKRLTNELSIAVGPLASVLVEDVLEDFGCTMNNFPTNRAAELVQLLTEEIARDEKRQIFTQRMLQIIQEKGY